MNSWHVVPQCPDSIEQLSQRFSIHPVVAKCLLSRMPPSSAEWDEEEVATILGEKKYQPPNPFLLPGMDTTVDRILTAVEKKEKICIFGDYDADGITAITVLMEAIEILGGDVFYYIPDRFSEGVGLTKDRILEIVEERHARLIITVDTGSRSVEEVAFSRSLNVDIIITDHHLPGNELPPAVAVLNPKIPGSTYPFPHLCGAGVAYKVVEALLDRKPGMYALEPFQKVVAIGTVADMVPLTGENRWLVQRGLKEISKETRGPLRLLLKKLGIKHKVYSQDISYKIAPRINAPGRLGDPDTAISFFREKKSYQEAERLVDILDGMNQVRQMLERDLEIRLNAQTRSISTTSLPPFILLAGKSWHRGILGITACKMLRKFERPVCVLSYDSGSANGSLRGLPGINLIDVLSEIESLFTSFGGHAEAAGVTLDVTNLPQFKKRMNELLAPKVNLPGVQRSCCVDAELKWNELTPLFIDDLMRMEPFGSGNCTPVFISRNLILESEIQRHGPWLTFLASDGMTQHRCSCYHPSELDELYEKYDSIDLVYSIIPFRDAYQVQVSQIQLS